MYRIVVSIRFLLWCVLFDGGMRHILKFDNRSVRCSSFCVGHYLHVRFLIPAHHLFLSKT